MSSLTAALQPDEVVIGGGNAHKLKDLPPGCRLGENAQAFRGGFLLWEGESTRPKVPVGAIANSQER